jgi:uncharacterized membrane protein YkoI
MPFRQAVQSGDQPSPVRRANATQLTTQEIAVKKTLEKALLAAHIAVVLALSAALVHAQATDIGFAKAEQIALTQVKGVVKEMERDHKNGKNVFKVDVRTPEGKSFDVTIDAADGKVLKVKQDD